MRQAVRQSELAEPHADAVRPPSLSDMTTRFRVLACRSTSTRDPALVWMLAVVVVLALSALGVRSDTMIHSIGLKRGRVRFYVLGNVQVGSQAALEAAP